MQTKAQLKSVRDSMAASIILSGTYNPFDKVENDALMFSCTSTQETIASLEEQMDSEGKLIAEDRAELRRLQSMLE